MKLCDEFPDGQSRLISFGVMNLTHYQSLEKPEQLRTGQWYDLKIQLDAIGYKYLHGHKLVLNIACAYWPMIWTPRRCTNLSLRGGCLSLPILQDVSKYSDEGCLYHKPQYGPPLDVEQIQPDFYGRSLTYGLSDMKKSIKIKGK